MRKGAAWYVAALIAAFGVLLTAPTPPRFQGAEQYSEEYSERRIKIVMFSTPNIVEQFAGLAAEVNALYARRHGYGFQHIVEDVPLGDRGAMVWKMVDVIWHALHEKEQWDAVFYIDSDAVFQNHTQRLDWLFEVPEGHIVGCSDHPNGPSYINTGTLFVRNTPRAKELLRKWSRMRSLDAYQKFPYEQQALEDLAKAEGYQGIVSRPAEEFNSVKARVDAGHRDTFVLHMMATPAAQRATEFRGLRSRLLQQP